MNIHWLQHVPFEGLGRIENWALEKEHRLRCTRLYTDDELPHQDDFQMLVVMGGPMGVHDEEEYSWLGREKKFLQDTIHAQKPVLGICLGAQLLATVLGADVVANEEKEIGWFPVKRNEAVPQVLLEVLPSELTVFHWHGDTFSMPDRSVRLYSSSVCINQAFLYGDRILALQFHLETTSAGVELLITHCNNELVDEKWIQTDERLLAANEKEYASMDNVLVNILDYLISRVEIGR